MLIAHTASKLHSELDRLRFCAGTRRCVSLVTTRGKLHAGHGAVINAAHTVSDLVVVAVYPEQSHRTDNLVSADEFQDMSFAEQHHADVLYCPQDRSLDDPAVKLNIELESEGHIQRDLLRAHLRILNAVQPDIMVWGERNYEEYVAVKQMIAALDIRTQVQCIPTVRHADGRAVSSLDEQTSEAEQRRLSILYETLKDAAHAIKAGAKNFSKVEKTARIALKGAGFEAVRFRILDEEQMRPANPTTTSFRLLTSATINGHTVDDSLGLSL